MTAKNTYTVLSVYCISLILLLGTTACNCSNNELSPSKKQPRVGIAQLELQVNDIVGGSNITLKIINKGSITADLSKYKLCVGQPIGTDRAGNVITDLKLAYSGATSIIEGRCIADKVLNFTDAKQKLAPSEVLVIDKIFLTVPNILNAASIPCQILNTDGQEINKKDIIWKAGVLKVEIDMPTDKLIYGNGEVEFKILCKNVSAVRLPASSILANFNFYDESCSLRFSKQGSIDGYILMQDDTIIQPGDSFSFSLKVKDDNAKQVVNFLQTCANNLLKVELLTKEGLWLGGAQQRIQVVDKGKLNIEIDPYKIELLKDKILIPIILKNTGEKVMNLVHLDYEFSIINDAGNFCLKTFNGNSITWTSSLLSNSQAEGFTIYLNQYDRDQLVIAKDLSSYSIQFTIRDNADIVGKMEQPIGLKIGPIGDESKVEIDTKIDKTNKFKLYKRLENGKSTYRLGHFPLVIRNISDHPLRVLDLWIQGRALLYQPIDGSTSTAQYIMNLGSMEKEYQFKSKNRMIQHLILYKENNEYGLPDKFAPTFDFLTSFTEPTDEQAKNRFVDGLQGGSMHRITIFEFDIVTKDSQGNCCKLGTTRVKLSGEHIDIIDETGATA
jgi:hypothetical protein